MTAPLRVALIDGPMYDGLDGVFVEEGVEVIVRGDHPALNRDVGRLLAAGERIDVISTHGKYAPSQSPWLRPLDDLIDPSLIAALAPQAVELCRFDGRLLCVPRNIDVRTLWYRTDLLGGAPPTSWTELEASGQSFGFPGRESGLFGTFFELVVGAGGRLFDDEHQPVIVSDDAVAAVEWLCRLAGRAPADLPTWHYDQVDDALLDARVAMAAAWPGGYGRIRASSLADRLDVAAYPAGPSRWVSYGGCHGWAIPLTAADVHASVRLVERLCSFEAASLDALGGSVCAHVVAFEAVEPRDEVDARRLEVTRRTIRDGLLTYPALAPFPEVEDTGWAALHDALRGRRSPTQAVEDVQAAAELALRR